MFVRFVKLTVKPDMEIAFERFYRTVTAPALMDITGCLFAHLIQQEDDPLAFMSMTFWRSHAEADAYEASGQYRDLVERHRPFLAETSEWKMELNEDLTLAYVPVQAEPEVEAFDVAAASTDAVPEETGLSHMHLRIVAGRAAEGRMEQLKAAYRDHVIPGLAEVDGCRYAYLVAGRDDLEVLSVTLWETRGHALAYEQTGRFRELVSKVRPHMSSLTQWKMALDPEKQSQTMTSDDMTVRGFRVLGGESKDDEDSGDQAAGSGKAGKA